MLATCVFVHRGGSADGVGKHEDQSLWLMKTNSGGRGGSGEGQLEIGDGVLKANSEMPP